MTFADELKAWRAREGYTQARAAGWLGVPVRTYQSWEQGRWEPEQVGPVRKLLEILKEEAQ